MRPVTFLVLLTCLLLSPAAVAQLDHQVAISAPFGPIYPPETWIPLDVTCLNGSDRAADGSVTVSVTVGPGISYSAPVRVAARSRTHKRMLIVLPDLRPSDVRGAAATQVGWVEWRDRGSAVLARSELFARPDTLPRIGSGSAPQAAQLSGRGLLVLTDAEEDSGISDLRIAAAAGVIEQSLGRPFLVSGAQPGVAPLEPAAYDGVHVIAIEAIRPDAIPPALRDTLLRFVRGGGVLLMSSTDPGADPRGSWLDPYLPVDVVGFRRADSLSRGNATPLPMKSLLPVCEAVLRDDAVLVLGDEANCHAAYRPLGLGRIAFIGFPPGGVRDAEQWSIIARSLLHLNALEVRLSRAEDRSDDAPLNVLSTMVGREAPPWRTAAVVCLALLVAVGAAHLLLGGPRRPVAFVVTAVMSLATAGVLVGLSAAGRGRENLVLAELSFTELGRDGGGIRREWMTLFGADDATLSVGVSEPEAPLQALTADKASLTQFPFAAPRAGSRAAGGPIWKTVTDTPTPPLRASLRFGPRGAELSVGQVTTPLDAPLLLFNGRAFPLAAVETASGLPVGNANPTGQVTHFATVSTEEARLRARLAAWSTAIPTTLAPLAADMAQTPLLLGFARQENPVITTSTTPARRLSQSLVKMELDIVPAEVGQSVRIPGGFVRLVNDASPGLAADASGTFRSSTTGAWLVGFAAPRDVGVLAPSRAELQLDASAALHRIALRRGQVVGGRVVDNPSGELVAELSQTIGDRQASFTPNDADIDENGWVWLRLEVTQPTQISDTSRRDWQISTLELTLEGKVVDRPRAPKQTWGRSNARPR